MDKTIVAGLTSLLLLPSIAVAEELSELVEDGYQVAHRAGYAEVEECTPDDPTIIGDYIFFCNGYEYKYHYGSVYIMARNENLEGRVYLCMRGKDECISGHVIRRRRG